MSAHRPLSGPGHSAGAALPKALAGFESIARSWDPAQKCHVARVLPGELYVSNSQEMITTVLGSCIAACICDPSTGIGGMNHFMLPDTTESSDGLATRYGLHAMEELINGIMKNGGRRDSLQVKLFGGGKMIPAMSDVGAKNISFAREYLKHEGLVIASEDLGSIYPRKVNYFPTTGRAMLKRLRPLHNQVLAEREQQLMQRITAAPKGNDVELF